jgi:hypothetical protein
MPGVNPDLIRADFAKGSGQEWTTKLRAIHSSAALAANSFGPWRANRRG